MGETTLEEPPVDAHFDDQPEIDVAAEHEPPRESVDTVAQLLDRWRGQYDESSGDVKRELGYKIIKMGEAIAFSGLKADEVKIREAEAGVLGFYVPATGETAMTLAGLELPPEHFQDVFVHEATHAGVTTGKKVADEGLTQIITKRKVSGAMSGIYESEQRDVMEAAANMDIKSIIDAYNFEKPLELIEQYLQTEWADFLTSKEQEIPLVSLQSEEGRDELIDGQAKTWVERIEFVLEKAAPRLVERAKDEGFIFATTHHHIIESVVKEKLRVV